MKDSNGVKIFVMDNESIRRSVSGVVGCKFPILLDTTVNLQF